MLDGNELKFGDLLVEKGKECNSLFMFLTYIASRSNIKLLKIPCDVYIPSVPVWEPDYESFLDSRYVRDHGFYKPILNMNYADPDIIKVHNSKANHFLNLGKWLYNCSLYPIDEWSDSDGAKQDAEKFFKTAYLIQGRGCGKTAWLKGLYERLENQKTPNIRYLRQKFEDVDATNAIKEFINKQYGANSFGRAVPDDSLDALRYVLPTVEQIREEFMMDLLYEGYVRAIDHDLGDDCIDMYVRVLAHDRNYVKFNFYRRSAVNPTYTVRFRNPTWDEHDVCDTCIEVINHKLIWQLFVQQNRNFLAKCKYWFTTKYGSSIKRDSSVKNFGAGSYIMNSQGVYHCVKECYLAPERREGYIKARLKAFKKPNGVSMDAWARTVKIRSGEHILKYHGIEETSLIYYIYDDGTVEIPCWKFVEDNNYPNKAELITDRVDIDNLDISKETEMLQNCYTKKFSKAMDRYKKEEETKKMDILKESFNSKLYMIRNGSEDLSYLGTVMGMSIDHVVGCELAGKIDFIADDEPVKKLQYFNREFIKNVVFNDPATIVEWKDGTKTVVQARDGEKFDPEKGLAMAIAKKAMGNKRDYYRVFKHYLKKVKTESVCGENSKTVIIPAEIADDVLKYIADTFCEKVAKANKGLKETIKSMPDEMYYGNQAIDLKNFKEDSENDLVTFKCSKADGERIKELIRGFNYKIDDVDGDGPC